MSKSERNALSPKDVIKKYGRDFMRYYFAKVSKGEDLAFNESDFKDVHKVFSVLLNVDSFINQIEKKRNKLRIEDKWILSRFNNVTKRTTEKFNSYKYFEALNELERFLIEDLSRSYIKMIRDRNEEVHGVLEEIREGLLKLYSPVVPFLTESIWQNLKEKKIVKEESVHLSSWPDYDESKIDSDLEKEFEAVQKIIEAGLRERDSKSVGLKWPLRKAEVECDVPVREEIFEIIKNQLNVKELDFKLSEKDTKVELDFETDDELEAEGFAREIARRVQAERKNRGLQKSDKINLVLFAGTDLRKKLDGFSEFIKERTGSEEVVFSDAEIAGGVRFKVKDKDICFDF